MTRARQLWTWTCDEGRLLNACLHVVEDLVVYWYYPYEEERSVLGALHANGSQAWTCDRPWIEHPIVFDGAIYSGGTHARRIDALAKSISIRKCCGPWARTG